MGFWPLSGDVRKTRPRKNLSNWWWICVRKRRVTTSGGIPGPGVSHLGTEALTQETMHLTFLLNHTNKGAYQRRGRTDICAPGVCVGGWGRGLSAITTTTDRDDGDCWLTETPCFLYAARPKKKRCNSPNFESCQVLLSQVKTRRISYPNSS